MHKAFPLFVLCGLVLFTSCDEKRIFDRYESLPSRWHKDSAVTFNIEAPDTIRNYNLFLNIRNNSDYEFSNLFLITEMRFPNGKVVSDTLEYSMTSPAGEWLGTGFGELKENKLWYKENIRFTEEGEYTINILQAMRKGGQTEGVDTLKGITEVGFRIENTYNQ